MLHRDRVRARVVRYDKRPPRRPHARDPRAPPAPIIGRLLHENGIWLVAPEDKRYGQDIMIPERDANATGPGGGGRADRAALDVRSRSAA